MNTPISAVFLALALTLVAGPAPASEVLVKKHNCQGCHDMAAKRSGPTWKAIADKNKGVGDAEKALAEATVKGSKNKYGKVPMPPQPKATADAETIARWILTL